MDINLIGTDNKMLTVKLAKSQRASAATLKQALSLNNILASREHQRMRCRDRVDDDGLT